MRPIHLLRGRRVRAHDATSSSSIFIWMTGWRVVWPVGWMPLEDDWAGAVGGNSSDAVEHHSAGTGRGPFVRRCDGRFGWHRGSTMRLAQGEDGLAGPVKDEAVAVGPEGVGIRYVESIKRKLLHTSVQLVHPSCSPLGRPPFTRVPRKCRSGSVVRPQVRPRGNRLAARRTPRSTPRHSVRRTPAD